MARLTKALIASAAALTLGLSACSGGAGGSGEGREAQSNSKLQAEWNVQPRDNIKDGGKLTQAVGEVTPQMNDWQGNMTADTSTLTSWFRPVTINSSQDGEFQPNKAYFENVKDEVKDGKTVVTYTINPKAVWNNGKPIDWTTIEAGWKACGGLNEQFQCNSTDGYDQIESVKQGKDAKEAVVTFKQEFPWWKGLFGSLLYPDAAKDPKVFNEAYVNNPHPEWGAGPYKIHTFDFKQGLVKFVPNEKWWGEKPKLDEVIYTQMEPSASINAFKNGQLDTAGVSTKDRLAQVKDMPGIDIRRGSTPSNGLLTLNSKNEFLSDKNVRHAIMTGVDRSLWAKIAFDGLDYKEDLPGSFLLFNFQEGYHDNFGDAAKYDKEAAKKMLDEAGWKDGDGGIRAKDGKKLSLNFVSFGDNPVRKNQLKALQSMMKDIGVDMVIQEKAATEFSKVIKERSFDMIYSGFLSSDPYGVAYTCQIWCKGSGLNKTGINNDEVDKQIRELMKKGDPKAQTDLANKAEALGFKDYGMMPMLNGVTIVAAKKGLANVGAAVFGTAPKENIGWQK